MFRESSLFQFKNGDHTCVFYRTQAEMMQILTPYVADGLRHGERCFCVQKPEILKSLVYDLMFLGIDPDREIKRGALDLRSEGEAYLPGGRFEPEAMMELLRRSLEEARQQGFRAFRTAGELSWAVEGRNECDQLVKYEQMVNAYFPGKPAKAICQYNMNKFEPELLQRVMDAHQMQIAATAENSDHASLNMRGTGWMAEVVADRKAVHPRYYYVVQDRQPTDIVGWGVEPDFESATASVDRLARDCSAMRPGRAGMLL